jgi:2-polyprenyl-3-methyl-5-hydroxy-6-metoxy-1,4-benzoquinol methylase
MPIEKISSCRLCGSGDLKFKYEINLSNILECNNCSFTQVNEIPSEHDLLKLYGDSYFKKGKYIEDRAIRYEQKRRLNWILKCRGKSNGRLLDVGCSTGDFISLAKNRFDIWGQDISEFAISNIISKYPDLSPRLSVCSIENSNYKDSFFDIITLWDVIEHLWEPVKIIKMLSKKLKPGGCLFISTPNTGAIIAKLLGKRWAFMTPPEHLCFFNKTTINMLNKKHNLKITDWISQGKWVNFGFLVYKLNRVFPDLISTNMVDYVQKSF